jgi:hypothetical protein
MNDNGWVLQEQAGNRNDVDKSLENTTTDTPHVLMSLDQLEESHQRRQKKR